MNVCGRDRKRGWDHQRSTVMGTFSMTRGVMSCALSRAEVPFRKRVERFGVSGGLRIGEGIGEGIGERCEAVAGVVPTTVSSTSPSSRTYVSRTSDSSTTQSAWHPAPQPTGAFVMASLAERKRRRTHVVSSRGTLYPVLLKACRFDTELSTMSSAVLDGGAAAVIRHSRSTDV